jgi:hypothetical protein
MSIFSEKIGEMRIIAKEAGREAGVRNVAGQPAVVASAV